MTNRAAQTVIIPEADDAAEEATDLLRASRGFTVSSAADLQAAADERGRVRQRYNEIEDLRKALKGPILAAAQNVDDRFRAPLQTLLQVLSVIDGAIKQFQETERRRVREEEERAAAEERRLQALADQARVEAEELLRQAAEAEAAGDTTSATGLESGAAELFDEAQNFILPSVPFEIPAKAAGLATVGVGSSSSSTMAGTCRGSSVRPI